MLIDDVVRNSDKYTDVGDRENFSPCYVDVGITARDGVVIEATSMKQYLYDAVPGDAAIGKYAMDHSHIITPPAQHSWVEWSTGGGKRAVNILYGDYDPEVICGGHDRDKIPVWLANANPSKMMLVTLFIDLPPEPWALHIAAWVFLDKDGMLIRNTANGPCIYVYPSHIKTLVNDRIYTDLMVESVSIAIFTFSMLHVKNVVQVEHKPDQKLQNRRKKKGFLPLVKYYTLEVEVPGKRAIGKSDARQGNTEGIGTRPLHLVRGHLADYRDGKGLFGKYKGVYYIPAHMRGDIDNGVIKKRYKIETDKR